MYSELKKIWKECFGDTDDYIDFYFARRYCPDHTLVHRVDGRAAAMLSLLPATVVRKPIENGELRIESCAKRPDGREATNNNSQFSTLNSQLSVQCLPARYIYAVGTLPEYRRRGVAAQLSAQADERMKASGVSLAVLAPASASLFDYYARLGYTTAFYRRVVTFPIENGELRVESCAKQPDGREATNNNSQFSILNSQLSVETLYALREQYFARCGFFVRWDCEALRYAMDECRLSGGEVYGIAAAPLHESMNAPPSAPLHESMKGEKHESENPFPTCRDLHAGYVFVEPDEQARILKVKETAITPAMAPALLAFLKARYADYAAVEFRLAVDSPLWRGQGVREPVAMLKELKIENGELRVESCAKRPDGCEAANNNFQFSILNSQFIDHAYIGLFND